VQKPYQHIGQLKYGCSLVRCQNCGHFFTEISGNADLGELYENEQYELIDTRRSIYGRLISFDVKSTLRQLERIKPVKNGASILDFGCGKGVFLHSAAERGWQANGIETATKRAAFAKINYGLNVVTNEYTGGTIEGGPFDVITLFHVLEHLPTPRSLIETLINRNLNANGMLVVEVPRFDSFQSVIAARAWIHLDPPRHLSHFSTNALQEMLHDLGLLVVASSQFSIHNGLLGMVQGIMSRMGYKKMLIEELKLRRTGGLVLIVSAVLPFALALELVACLFGRGGIVRYYCSRASDVSGRINDPNLSI
jgi:SAM-dependent methyltransferase